MSTGLLKMKDYPVVIGGRYGLGSYEFTGAMAKGVFDQLSEKSPKNHFTIGINDDVTHTSLPFDPAFSSEPAGVHRAMFYGLGADGTIGANKNSIKIIGKATDNYVQGYFVLDSKKSGSTTISHLRFGKKPIKSTYLISKASFLACHKFSFLDRLDMLSQADEGAVFLLNSPFSKDEVWGKIPVEVQKQIIDKKLKFYVINGTKIADEVGLRGRINVTMQTAFFLISGVLEESKALELIKTAIEDTYGNKGRDIVEMNMKAVETTRSRIERVEYPAHTEGALHMLPPVPAQAPEFVRSVTAAIIAGQGRDAACFQAAGRRHVAHGNDEMGEAQHRGRHPGLGFRDLHPVRRVLHGLPPRGHPHESLRSRSSEKGPGHPSSPSTRRARSSRE